MQDNNKKKIRGKAAIEEAHRGLIGEDEGRIDSMISNLYGVENDEAADIHASYHIERILLLLESRARDKGMRKEAFVRKVQNLDVSGAANQVAKGKITEAAVVDALFRGLSNMESTTREDRYINFYS
jgi:hypothetical protein